MVMHPVQRDERLPLRRYVRGYALPTAASLFGAHQAISILRSSGDIISAAFTFAAWTLAGVGALLAARLLGLRTDAEIAASPELQRRVRARRPLVVAAVAALALAMILANVLD